MRKSKSIDDANRSLELFTGWGQAAERVVNDIGAWRDRLQWRTNLTLTPWPTLPDDFDAMTNAVIAFLREQSIADDPCIEQIRGAAKTWLADRSPDRVPECREVLLNWYVATTLLDRAAFPLFARIYFDRPVDGSQPLLSRYIHNSLKIVERCARLKDDWPPQSEARWRLFHAVFPRSIPNVGHTSLALCLAEAHRNNELSTLSPILEDLEKGIREYLDKFRSSDSCDNQLVHDPVNRLLPYHRVIASKGTLGLGATISDAKAGASGLTVVSQDQLELMIRKQVKLESKNSLTDDILIAAYRQHGSMRKAAMFLSAETGQQISKDKVYRAVERAGGVGAVRATEDSDSVQRIVASQRRDRQRKFASPTQPPEIE